MAEFGGSWKFIIWFGVLLFIWIAANSAVILWRPFAPYPFILLNLMLFLFAAVQAPIIMMNQNRQEDRDRINLKSELEVRLMTVKIDQLLHQEMRRFMEIQQIQMDMLKDMHSKLR